MDDRVLRLRVGVVVLAAAMITAFLVARFGDLPLLGASTYTVYVRFPNAPGVTPGTPVRKSGVEIGRVIDLRLLDPEGVRLELAIDRSRTLRTVDAVWITSASVLGDSVVEFVSPDPTPPGAAPIEDRTEIVNGRVRSNPLEVLTSLEPTLQDSLLSVRNAGNEVAVAARNLSAAVGDDPNQLPRVAQKAEAAFDQFSVAMTNFNTIFDDPEICENLRRSLRDLPGTLDKANAAFDSMKSASDRATQNLDSLKNFTGPLGERGPQIVDNLDGSLANINELLQQLATFSDTLNRREGTLGRILSDDSLYLRLERTLANAEELTARMKPILDDIRVFSDKIARDPRQLGLKGALDKRPIGIGAKPPPHTVGGSDQPIIVERDAWDPVIIP